MMLWKIQTNLHEHLMNHKSICNSDFFETAKTTFKNVRRHFIQPITNFLGKYSLQKIIKFHFVFQFIESSIS